MKGSRRSGYAIAVFAGLTIASCEACEKEDQPPVGTGVKGGVMLAGTLSTAQCPGHGNVVIQGADPGNPVVYDTLPLVGTITNVPEFHDCQRFIDSTGGTYGPLVAIFAVASSAGFNPTPATPRRGLDLRDGPESSDPDAVAAPGPRGPRHPDGFAVGIIVNFDKVRYEPLGIEPGINCLYVYPSSDGPHGFGATIVPVGLTGMACARAYSASMTGTDLLVYSKRMPLDHPDDYPPVARWDWDPKSSTQYLGIRCGPRWCEAGQKAGFTRSATHLYPILDRKERRVYAVKGWHDEQWLARPGIAGLFPQAYQGTLVPVKNLAEIDATTFGQVQWTEVARVSISPYDPVYETKYFFTTTSMPNKMNYIALCQGDFRECRLADDPAASVSRTPSCPGNAASRWWARITNTRGQKHFSCVTRTPHVGVTMPGTARWLWEDNDELIWVECDEGCCRVHRPDE